MNEDTSLHHRLRLKFGYIYVPEDKLLPVIRDGRIHSFRNGGYHHKAGWRQCYGKPISIALRFAQAERIPIHTADSLPLFISASLKYTFDPRRSQPHLTSRIAGLDGYSLNGMVENYFRGALRAVCGRYLEAQLADGRSRSGLERDIRHELQRHLAHFGLLIKGDTAVAITAINLPPDIERERIAAQARTIYADSIRQQPKEMALNLHEQQLAQHSEHLNLTFLKTAEESSLEQHILAPVHSLAPHNNGHSQSHTKEVNG